MSGTQEKAPKGPPYILACQIVNDGSGGERLTILRLIHAARLASGAVGEPSSTGGDCSGHEPFT